ncbi:hypothetical protein WG899_04985 [Paucibacter sp. AS339]|uniref:hypothetical protein n=1 Tax=Paucibacter hankyongi TaxID=3133434 RepID=UPI0030AA7DB9
MNRTSFSKLAIAAILPMTLGMGLAHAETPVTMKRVEVAGQANPDIAKLNVAKACPGIEKTLKEELDSQWERIGQPGLVRVQFRLHGDQINSVSARGGPDAYRQSIRRAVHHLSCSDSSGTNQLYAFELHFKETGSPSGAQTVALLSR